jgi:glycosyltransferase involved in cell wall biosynthesis
MLSTNHSFAHVNRKLSAALYEAGCDIGLISTNGMADVETEPTLRNLIVPPDARGTIGYAETVPKNLARINADRRICIYNFETSVLPPVWRDELNLRADLVLPSSAFCREVFIQSGVSAEKTFVLPHGIDPRAYHPAVPPMDLATDKYKFLCVAEPHARKGWDILLQAFAEEFRAEEPVMLVVKTRMPAAERLPYEIDLRRMLDDYALGGPRPELRVITEGLPSLGALYTACDCFVLPTRGEGFCVPALEAIACKRPVIVTGYSGQCDFVSDENAWLISYKMRPADAAMQYWQFVPGAQCAEPDRDHLRALMRHVYDHRDEARAKAERAYAGNFPALTWASVAERFIEIVNAQDWGEPCKVRRIPCMMIQL